MTLEATHTAIDMYADDTTLHTYGTNKEEIEKKLNYDANTINNWCLNNRMVINPLKTTSMLIGTNKKRTLLGNDMNICIQDSPITPVEIQKLLGVYIDKHLDWKFQIDYVCKNLSSRIALLSRIKKFLDISSRKLFYNAYILPIFDFCCSIWGNCYEDGYKKILKMQKRAARIILDAPILTHSINLFKELKWLNFKSRISYHKLILVHKILNDKAPDYLKELCRPIVNLHSRNLRSSANNNLAVVRPNTNSMKKSFAYSSSILWNKLPNEIKCCENLDTFKQKCVDFLSINDL
ncbi:Hypothetical predicted protein [Mytilus galloprovincialis]|uniref:Reverse transcriptase domain-containing protein n=1 Tax=Mytilus galloprovincialis TaxID=29158 RepID=A0A8B6HG05_MYTGA|nr:Hypothetical predicted protein [Mytilus galloprovincialis]